MPNKNGAPDSSDEKNGRKKSFWRKTTVLLLLSALLAAFVWWNFFRSKPLTISPETTRLTEPLTPDGKYVDYAAVLRNSMPPEIATDENAARSLVRRFGVELDSPFGELSEAEKSVRERNVRVRLGLEPDAKPETRYLAPNRAIDEFLQETAPQLSAGERRERGDKLFFGGNDLFHDVTSDPEFTVWYLTKYGENLDTLADTVKKPIFLFPPSVDWPDSLSTDAGNLRQRRDFATGLGFRARAKLAAGDFSAAVDDLLALRRFGNRLRENPNRTTDLLAGLAIGQVEFYPPMVVPEKGIAPPEEIGRLLAEPFEKLPAEADLQRIWEREETILLDQLEHLARQDPKTLQIMSDWFQREGFPDGFFHAGIDWNCVFRTFRETLARFYADPDQMMFETVVRRQTDLNRNRWFSEEYRRDHTEMYEVSNMSSGWFSSQWWTISRRSEYFGRKIAESVTFDYYNLQAELGRYGCQANLRRIALAMLLYRAEHDGAFPPAFTVDAQGNPLHSWRVLLLPYLGEKELYAQIRLDEPWESEWNRRLHDQCPEVYRCPTAEKCTPKRLRITSIPWGEQRDDPTILAPKAGETNYSVIVGPNTLFDGSGVGKKPEKTGEPQDALFSTVLVTERLDAVNWMKPDAEITEVNALIGLNPFLINEEGEVRRKPGTIGSLHGIGVVAAMTNGASSTLVYNIPQEVLHLLITGKTSNLPPSDVFE